jgi:transcriptional regulator with XRE-family HTH domain
MPSKSSSAKPKKPLAGSPLGVLRDLVGWTREECARHAGTSVASVQNYERGFAPLPRELALALEGACGVNAADLLEQNTRWLESGGKVRCKGILSMGALPYSRETFTKYRKKTITETVRDSAVEDVQRRCRLVLGPLASKPHLFRTAYRKLVQTLEELRARMEISEPEMAEFASQGAEVHEFEWTLGEVASEADIAASPRWMAAKVLERFRTLDKVRVRQEIFPFWPISLPDQPESGREMVPDWQLCRRIVWRIALPDHSHIVLPVDKFEAAGLVRKVGKPVEAPNPAAALPPALEGHSEGTWHRKGSGPKATKTPKRKSPRRK